MICPSEPLNAGDLAEIRLIPETWAGHYYKNGDIVRVGRYEEETGYYKVYVLRAQRGLHFLLRRDNLRQLSPLQALAIAGDKAQDD